MTMQPGRQQPPNRGRLPPRSTSPSQQPLQLPTGYLSKGYFDANGHIFPEVIVDWARDIADKLSRSDLKVAQLQNFFREARSIEKQIQSGKDFSAAKGSILRLDPLVTNAVNKGNAPLLFKQFMQQNLVWASRDKKSFVEGFVTHFECVRAYFPKDK